MRKKAIFLDRDGVLNKVFLRGGVPHPPVKLSEVSILPDVKTALCLLQAAGYELIVVTNQPDVARGVISRKQVESVHAVLKAKLPIKHFYVCYHDDHDQCHCRKPKPGLIFDAARDHAVDVSSSFMVGDRWKDIVAGNQAGCRTFFVDAAYAESANRKIAADFVVGSLIQVANKILTLA